MSSGKNFHRPGDGYWIAPTEHVLRLKTRHIVAVCERPEAFGISNRELEALFTSRREAWATEQSAREIVIKALVIQAAWIRVRHYHRRHGYWSFNMPSLGAEQLARVAAFFRLLADSIDPEAQVRLDAPEAQEWTTIRALTETHCLPSPPIVLVEEIQELPTSSMEVQLPASPENPSVPSPHR